MQTNSITLKHPEYGTVSFTRLTERQIQVLTAVKGLSESASSKHKKRK